jgi:hypothetical protein
MMKYTSVIMVEEPVNYEAIGRSVDIRKEVIEDACHD